MNAAGPDPWGTHAYVLAAVVAATDGPVLELGMGHYSSPLLHLACRAQARSLVSIETSADWIDRFRWMRGPYHQVLLVGSWDEAPVERDCWSVALVDHHPPERRGVELARLIGRADYVVAHDTETDGPDFAAYGYGRMFPRFRFRADFTEYRPWTSVLSDTVDPAVLLDGFARRLGAP